ncbi:MAG: hypothetical protein WBM40_06155 [Thiohalocapsa sp.]
MKSLFLLFLFGILIVGVALFFKGQSNSVKLNHICGKEVSWYHAMFLDAVEDKAGCEKYQ